MPHDTAVLDAEAAAARRTAEASTTSDGRRAEASATDDLRSLSAGLDRL